eukprot:5314588-Pyramimonas_sp.AAC.1
MESAEFLDTYAQTTGAPRAPRAGSQPGNSYVRATADDFYRSQITKGAGCVAGILGQVPHYGHLAHMAPPVDQDVIPRGPELTLPASPGDLRPELLAMQEAQQANISAQRARLQRNQARRA